MINKQEEKTLALQSSVCLCIDVETGFSRTQLDEIEKLLKYIKQMEGIIRTSPNKEQVERVKKEIQKHKDKLSSIVPGIKGNQTADDIRAALGFTTLSENEGPGAFIPAGADILAKFPVQKASPHSSDAEVNFVSTILTTIQKEYWPAISDLHCKMDFSHTAERDLLRTQLDNALRNLKVLAETIEEYSQAEKQDFRDQLLKMKNKQTRIFLYETNQILKKIRDFLRDLIQDIKNGGNPILNKNDAIHFNSRFEEATALEGVRVGDALIEFDMYATQAVERINLPELKINKP